MIRKEDKMKINKDCVMAIILQMKMRIMKVHLKSIQCITKISNKIIQKNNNKSSKKMTTVRNNN